MSEEETPKTPTPESGSAPVGDTAVADAPADEQLGKLRQDVDIKDVGPCKKHIKVTVNRSDIDERMDEKISKLVVEDHAMVAGFRPARRRAKSSSAATTRM